MMKFLLFCLLGAHTHALRMQNKGRDSTEIEPLDTHKLDSLVHKLDSSDGSDLTETEILTGICKVKFGCVQIPNYLTNACCAACGLFQAGNMAHCMAKGMHNIPNALKVTAAIL